MIDTEKDNRKLVERAILVGIHKHQESTADAHEHLAELEELVANLNIPVIDKMVVKIKKPQAKYYIGSGKAAEIVEMIVEQKADCLVFDGELSPSQQRNWERLTKICVIDRQEVILDIFASRASTREAVLQVELARMKYSLPRLTRAWTHLSRQRGGNKGTRGEGEKQIEADRRMVQQRINSLKKELLEVQQQRSTQRKSRDRHQLPHAAIVGYTNAGKSSLLNALTGSDVVVEDKLFATLDPTTRKVVLPDNRQLLLTDTVGFVRKLPHNLVEAFKSTLEEAVLADFLVLVLDISSPHVEDHWETTMNVLRELKADNKKILPVFNKTDLADDPLIYARVKNLFEESLFVSTKTGAGLNELKRKLMKYLPQTTEVIRLKLPPSRHDLAALAHARTMVMNSEYDENGNLELVVNMNCDIKNKFADFMV
ncbi:MAG: GTPase HflX [Victivallaceae bacterium]|nr:GTPase HflX [Victivallaceae bacterium]